MLARRQVGNAVTRELAAGISAIDSHQNRFGRAADKLALAPRPVHVGRLETEPRDVVGRNMYLALLGGGAEVDLFVRHTRGARVRQQSA